MKKLKVFLLAFVMVLCGTIVLSACGKDDEPEKPIVAVESTVNPILIGGNSYSAESVLGTIFISTSVGDTPGELKWETPTARILLGENEYTWIFTPEDTQRFKSASGTLTLIGIPDYDLTVDIDDWVYGQASSEPMILGYTGLSENISTTYKYYNKSGTLLDEKPTEAGEYRLCATVTIVGLENPINIWVYSFKILKADITDFGLSIEGWTFNETANAPTVNDELEDIVDFVYSSSENGTYTNTIPSNAGTYYVKAVINNDNFSGVCSPIQFVIEKASYEGLVTVGMTGWTYGDTANEVTVSSSAFEVANLDITKLYAVKGSNDFVETVPTDAGEYTAKVVVGASIDGNYSETEFTTDFVIQQANFAGTISELGSVVYDNTSKAPSVVISGYTASDYTLSWKYKEINADDSEYVDLDTNVNNFVNAGVYKVTAVGTGNYKGGEVSAIYTIKPDVTSAGELKTALDNNLKTINVTEDIEISANLEISNATNIVIASGKTLTVASGVTLTIVDGVTIGGEGSFVNNGTVVFNTSILSEIPSYVNKVVVQDDVTSVKTITLANACEIDLNGKTLTNIKFVIKNSVTIKNGTINNTGNGIEISTSDVCTINLEKINVTASGYVLVSNGSTGSSTINISNNCQFTSTGDVAMLLVDNHTYNFTSATITGKNGLYIKAGTVNLNTCTVTGNGTINDEPSEDLVATGHAIYVNAVEEVTLTIDGSTLKSGQSSRVWILEWQPVMDDTVTITIKVDESINIDDNISKVIADVEYIVE